MDGGTYTLRWFAQNNDVYDVSNAVTVVTFPAGTSVVSVTSASDPFPSPPVVTVLPSGDTEVKVYMATIKMRIQQIVRMDWTLDDSCISGLLVVVNGTIAVDSGGSLTCSVNGTPVQVRPYIPHRKLMSSVRRLRCIFWHCDGQWYQSE